MTHSLKKAEAVIADILHSRPVANQYALINPGSQMYYDQVAEQLKE